MNERIQGLVLEAQIQAIETIQNSSEYEAKVFEKFAELIVRECMNVARQQRDPANLNYKPSERFVEDLRQHFGVEE